MKNLNILSIFLICTTFFLNSCIKKDKEVIPGLSQKIQNIVTQEALDDLKTKGIIIHEGNQPPNIEGIFQIKPSVVIAPFGPTDSFKKGSLVANNTMKLSSQKNDEILYEEKTENYNSYQASTASFLSGNGNNFTLFSETSGILNGINAKKIVIISGEISPAGIKNLKWALIVTQKKDDINNSKLMPINKARVYEDGNGLASKVSNFRLSAEDSKRNSTIAKKDENALSINTSSLTDALLKLK